MELVVKRAVVPAVTTLKEKLIDTGAKAVSHGPFAAFQMAGAAIPRHRFADIPRLIVEGAARKANRGC